MRIRARWVAPALLVCAVASGAAQTTTQELKQLSIEELMQVNVTLAAERPEPIATTPAAISVITGDDIRRAGVTTIADAIGLADGVEVARFNNGTWSITARGFNAVTANWRTRASCLKSRCRRTAPTCAPSTARRPRWMRSRRACLTCS